MHSAPVIAAAVFLLGLTTAAGLYFGLLAPRRAGRGHFRGHFGGAAVLGDTPSRLARSSVRWSGTSGRIFDRWVKWTATAEETGSLHTALARAGFNRPDQAAVYLAVRIATPVLMISAAMVYGSLHPRWRDAAILGGAVIGYLLPDYVLSRLGQRRRKKILRELPTVLDLLVVTLEAGMGLEAAIKIVGREAERQHRVLGKEFATAAAEMSAGVRLEDSLNGLAERTGVDDVKSTVAVLIQSKEIGGRLGPSLRAAAELLTSKRRLKAEEAAQKSSIKMLIPLVLLVLPAMMIIILGPAVIQIFEMLAGATS